MNFESELLKLESDLLSGSYKPGPYSCFAVSEPKVREVWAAHFRDRILHHLLVNKIEPIWEKKFIFHSFACREGKGAHRAVKSVREAISDSSRLFFMQLDIRSFFVSINKNVLFSILQKHIKNPCLLWLSEKTIFQHPPLNCVIKGDKKLLDLIPHHKSLFYNPPHKGLPIGNLTSQFFANVYLNELDQFIKHSLKCRHYFRYMDDFLLINEDKLQLIRWRSEIENFLREQLDIALHPRKQIIQPVNCGINFCGYIIKPDYTLIRRRTVKRLKDRLWRFNRKILSKYSPDYIFNNRFSIFPECLGDFKHIFDSVNSTYGFLKHANCYGLRKTLYKKRFGILKIYLVPANENFDFFKWVDKN